ncbi:3-phosphoshikimate 1-carboxyvinyltransferase [Bacteroidota bacterium]
MQYKLQMDKKELQGSISLPASKSISNRLLILNALADQAGTLENLSDSDDTRVLKQALQSGKRTIDVGHAGTAMRFLTAYLSIQEGSYVLTGSQRMRQRPIGKLVEVMNKMGAGIEYLENPGYPPLSIQGRRITGGKISVDSSISSQYISALMMIAPALKNGLHIHLENEIVSSSYIHLTRNLMLNLGIPVKFSGPEIQIPFNRFNGIDMSIESDWSAASYWYALAVLSSRTELELRGLRDESYQGDSVLPEMFRPLGVETIFRKDGILLKKTLESTKRFEFDFSDSPDLVQTMVVLCGLIDLPFQMKGTRTLKIKETDRINALQVEMRKLGIVISADPGGSWISWEGKKTSEIPQIKQIKTYQDHRMAMAFSPAALKHPGLIIDDPEVVDKSYPGFWKDLESTGFILKKLN